MPKKHLLEAIATLVGFVIGAGILGIPFVVAKAGFVTGIIDIIVIGIVILFLNLYIGEIVLRTKGDHQLTGYANIYLGKIGKKLMTFGMMFGMYGALVAYTIKEGEFLNAILSPQFGGSPLIYSILFFIAVSFLVYKGLRIIEESELLMVFFLLFIGFIIFILAFSSINQENLTSFNIKNIFIPYGVVLFAYLGIGAIPELREELKNNKEDMKKAIIIGSLIPIVVYLIFAFIVVGVTGNATTEGAILGLATVLGFKMLLFGTAFGILTMATSFIAVGLALKEMYCFDFGCKKNLASSLVCFLPLAIALIMIMTNIDNAFFKVIDITGAFSGGLMGVLVVLMIWKAKKFGQRKPEYSIKENKLLNLTFIAMFIAGTIYEILKIIGLVRI
ncbi:GerAB/ArcD/ProY family transporter [Candidatus Woesearchaeota archaeon]|nr:GerAB/ArcD/ProY family transporter [Candidatus Woesearchaeota archaeon]